LNNRRCSWAVVLVLGTMILSGCVTAISERTEGPRFTVVAPVTSVPAQTSEAAPTPATATAEAPATEEPASTPEPAPTEASVEVRQVAYDGIRFTFDPAIAAEVVAKRVPPTKDPPQLREPGHLQFSLEEYVLAGTFHAPRILVYPVAGYRTANEQVARTIDELQQLLVDRPTSPDSIPFLPLFPAAQMMRARVAYLDFQNGTGVRFLTQYAQAYLPINNHELFYTFQGLTDDGQTYVSAILPVAHPSLPASQEAYQGDLNVLIQSFDGYIAGVEQQLNAQDTSSFVPDLDVLDAMLQSLEVAPQQAVGPTVHEEDSEGADQPFLTVDEFPIVAAAVDGPGHLEYTNRVGEEVLKRLRDRAEEGLLVRNNATLAPFGYRLLPRHDVQWSQTFYDLYQGEGEGPMLPGLSRVWPVSVSASGSDSILAAENAPNAEPQYVLVSKDGVGKWDAEASVLLPPVYVGDFLASVTCTGFPALACQVALDGQAVYTGTALAVGAYMPLHTFVSWDGHWALEMDDHLIVDGEDVGQVQGYDAAFGLSLIRGRPFYFFEHEGSVHISYDGQTLPNVYDEVYHNQCCEGSIHNVAAGEDVAWFHARRDGMWYLVVARAEEDVTLSEQIVRTLAFAG
jgi:hypothetical protein